MDEDRLKIIYINKSDLAHLNGNPRHKIDDNSVDKLKKLIKEHGFQNPLQVYQQGKVWEIICGNHRFDAGLELGMKEFPCLIYTGAKKMALARAISDNKSGLWTEWDYPLLKDYIVELDEGDFDMDLTGFDGDELEEMFGITIEEGLTDEDSIPDNPEEPTAKLGDIYQLGPHRLMCGDSTNIESIDALMAGEKADMVFTDPPYDFKDDFLSICFDLCDKGHIFVMDSDKNHAVNAGKYFEKFNVFYVLFFKAPTWNLSKKIPLTQHLLIAHYRTEGAINRELPMLHSVIETSTKNDRSVKDYVAKRLEAIDPFIIGFSDENNSVLDLFGGAGSILISCEKNRRKWRGMELNPSCCDVIIKRWENYTGENAKLIKPS